MEPAWSIVRIKSINFSSSKSRDEKERGLTPCSTLRGQRDQVSVTPGVRLLMLRFITVESSYLPERKSALLQNLRLGHAGDGRHMKNI